MDITAFSADGFDPKDWINQQFKPQQVADKENSLVTTISKLQLYVQQVNGAIEETSEHVMKNIPRVMHDADMIQKEAVMLEKKMQIVKEEINKIQRDTAASMASLEKLDKVKTELQVAKHALHEADNWSVLASDIEEVFETQNIDAVTAKVISMQQSLAVFENAVDFQERQMQLEGFKNRLEAMASPHLVRAFTNKNVGESRKFVQMFAGMKRTAQLMKYFARCEKANIVQEWARLVELDQDHSVLEWLSAFYHRIISDWQSNLKWCQQVFGHVDMLPSLYVDVLVTIQKEVIPCVNVALKQQTDPLSFLISLREVSDRFASSIQVAGLLQGCQDTDATTRILSAIYSLYSGYVSRYGEMEERHLGRYVTDSVQTSSDPTELVQALVQANSPVVGACGKALSRCFAFTEGAAIAGLLSAVQFCLLKHVDHFRSAMSLIEIEKQNKEEWSMFQTCLNLLHCISDFQRLVNDLDKEIVSAVLDSFKNNEKSSDLDLRSILLSDAEFRKLTQSVAALKDMNEPALLEELKEKVDKVLKKSHQVSLDVIFAPIAKQLKNAQTAWEASSFTTQQLPDYGYAPLGYITQIGEYLMTLPQHLEPFLAREGGESLADLLLGNVAKQTCVSYADLLLTLHDVSPNAAKQISIDIAYLGNVLEDLGFALTDTISQIATLLKLAPDTYHAQSAGCSPKLVAMVRQMRNITSS
ncbi:oligomeric golgi complex [Nesidiocoris tenuis]|uniref:Conserved oligomeric Golgi complex subunit 7 n=1 Tax=Nesidiocoris tenuis TaxID=355587 RepID=A0ABN7B1P9_9HEMI|nr:oligomeric golgi complex [Nesidiocoris tenuis]